MTLGDWITSHLTRQFFDPRVRSVGLRWKHYGIGAISGGAIAGVLVWVLIWLGLLFGATYGVSYFEHRFHVGQPVPVKHQKAPVPSGPAPPNAATLSVVFLPSAHNQGNANGCESYLFNKLVDFQWNKNHPRQSIWTSPWWFYAWAGHGRNVSTNLGSYNKILRLHGAIPATRYPAPAIPTAAHLRKPQLRYARYARPIVMSRHWLWRYTGAGWGAVVLGQRTIDTGHLLGVNIEVDRSIYTTAAIDGWYDPAINASGRLAGGLLFGHGIVCFRFDNLHRFPNGDAGGFLCQNSWGDHFGVNCKSGVRSSDSGDGCFWVAYRTFETVSYAAEYQTYHGGAPGKVAGPRAGWKPVPAPNLAQKAPLPSAGYGTIYVRGVTTRDTGVDISNAVNQACAAYHIGWDCSVGLVALFGVESGIRQYAPHSPIGAWDVCDWSGGLSQINVCTAASYGVGNGTAYEPNVSNVLDYEQADPVRDVWLTAKALADFKAHVCWDWYELYASWNEGDGLGCWSTLYQYPDNPITIQAVASFRQWYSDVWTEYGTFVKPPPGPPSTNPSDPGKPRLPTRLTKAQARVWNEYRTEHKLRVISPRSKTGLKWAGRAWLHIPAAKIGGVVRQPRWFHGKRNGWMKWSFQGGSVYLHPYDGKSNVSYHRWKR